MTNVVTAAVIELEAHGLERVNAHRRWHDPEPGQAVVVVTMADDWAVVRTTAEVPVLRVQVVAAPSARGNDAEAIALLAAGRVRAVLHRPQGGVVWWADLRVLSALHVGSGLAEVEGHEAWRVRSLVFEVQTG